MKTRILSIIVALIIFVPLLYWGKIPFAIGMGVLSILVYIEILDLKKSHKEIPNIVKVLGLISIIYLVLGSGTLLISGEKKFEIMVNYTKILIPFIVLLLPTIFYKKDKYTTTDAFYLLGFIYVLGLFFNLVILLRDTEQMGMNLIIYLLSITIFTDTFAYIIGKLIGKHKMCKISPNKTWEGAVAGLIGGVAISDIIFCHLIGDFSIKLLLVTIILSIIGQIGDLVFSKIKRENKIKDFSNIMPGHGGVLDRIDSFIFVVIAYVIIRSIII